MTYKEYIASMTGMYRKVTEDIYFNEIGEQYLGFDPAGDLLTITPSFGKANSAVREAIAEMEKIPSTDIPPSTESVEEEDTRWVLSLLLGQADQELVEEQEDEEVPEEVSELIDQAVDKELDQMYGYFDESLDTTEDVLDEIDYEDETDEYLYEHTLAIDPNWTLHEFALHIGDSVRASIVLWGNLQVGDGKPS